MINRSELLEIIISNLGLRELSTEKQGVVVHRLAANIASRINIAILECLSESQHQELLRLAEEASEREVSTFLHHKISDLDQLMKKIAAEVVTEFKTLSRQ